MAPSRKSVKSNQNEKPKDHPLIKLVLRKTFHESKIPQFTTPHTQGSTADHSPNRSNDTDRAISSWVDVCAASHSGRGNRLPIISSFVDTNDATLAPFIFPCESCIHSHAPLPGRQSDIHNHPSHDTYDDSTRSAIASGYVKSHDSAADAVSCFDPMNRWPIVACPHSHPCVCCKCDCRDHRPVARMGCMSCVPSMREARGEV